MTIAETISRLLGDYGDRYTAAPGVRLSDLLYITDPTDERLSKTRWRHTFRDGSTIIDDCTRWEIGPTAEIDDDA